MAHGGNAQDAWKLFDKHRPPQPPLPLSVRLSPDGRALFVFC